MTPLQRFVQYVIIFSALINVGNFLIACDRYSREIQQSRPVYTDVRSGDFDKIR